MHRIPLLCSGLVLAGIAAGSACAQPAASLPRFEAASIRLNTSGDPGSSNDLMSAYVTFHNYSFRAIIRLAFMVDDLSLDGPGWLGDLRFDITAKAPGGPAILDERRKMLQAMLYDRFGLAVHHTSVSRSGFALVTAKGGVRVAAVEDSGGHVNDMRDGNIKMLRTTISNFAEALAVKLKQPVVDETQLSGVYNVTLTYAPDRGADTPVGDERPSIFRALEE
jgi:uncharacterized protein (TIGR03435 family)